jgi:hypothetical protein
MTNFVQSLPSPKMPNIYCLCRNNEFPFYLSIDGDETPIQIEAMIASHLGKRPDELSYSFDGTPPVVRLVQYLSCGFLIHTTREYPLKVTSNSPLIKTIQKIFHGKKGAKNQDLIGAGVPGFPYLIN